MPSASQELHDLITKWFGESDYGSDHAPIQFLHSRGYVLTGDWRWIPPVPSHTISEEELNCLQFLIDEWDFGGIYPREEGMPACR